MGSEKKIYDLKILLLVLIGIPWIASTNIDCGGKSFHCLNSTHFMICVDLGGGLSMTVDDFVIPCPPPTICQGNNRFECEFPVQSTSAPTVQPIIVTNERETTTLSWEEIGVTTTNTEEEQHLELSTVLEIDPTVITLKPTTVNETLIITENNVNAATTEASLIETTLLDLLTVDTSNRSTTIEVVENDLMSTSKTDGSFTSVPFDLSPVSEPETFPANGTIQIKGPTLVSTTETINNTAANFELNNAQTTTESLSFSSAITVDIPILNKNGTKSIDVAIVSTTEALNNTTANFDIINVQTTTESLDFTTSIISDVSIIDENNTQSIDPIITNSTLIDTTIHSQQDNWPTISESLDLSTVITTVVPIITENITLLINSTITNATETPNKTDANFELGTTTESMGFNTVLTSDFPIMNENITQSIDSTSKNLYTTFNDTSVHFQKDNGENTTEYLDLSTITTVPTIYALDINENITQLIDFTITNATEILNNTDVNVEFQTKTDTIDLTTDLTTDVPMIYENITQLINSTKTDATEASNTTVMNVVVQSTTESMDLTSVLTLDEKENTTQSIDSIILNTIKATNDKVVPDNALTITEYQDRNDVTANGPVKNENITQLINSTITNATKLSNRRDVNIELQATTEYINLITVLTSDFPIIDENPVQIINSTINNATETSNTTDVNLKQQTTTVSMDSTTAVTSDVSIRSENTTKSIDSILPITNKALNNTAVYVEQDKGLTTTEFLDFITVLSTDVPVINDNITQQGMHSTNIYATDIRNRKDIIVESPTTTESMDLSTASPSDFTIIENTTKSVDSIKIITAKAPNDTTEDAQNNNGLTITESLGLSTTQISDITVINEIIPQLIYSTTTKATETQNNTDVNFTYATEPMDLTTVLTSDVTNINLNITESTDSIITNTTETLNHDSSEYVEMDNGLTIKDTLGFRVVLTTNDPDKNRNLTKLINSTIENANKTLSNTGVDFDLKTVTEYIDVTTVVTTEAPGKNVNTNKSVNSVISVTTIGQTNTEVNAQKNNEQTITESLDLSTILTTNVLVLNENITQQNRSPETNIVETPNNTVMKVELKVPTESMDFTTFLTSDVPVVPPSTDSIITVTTETSNVTALNDGQNNRLTITETLNLTTDVRAMNEKALQAPTDTVVYVEPDYGLTITESQDRTALTTDVPFKYGNITELIRNAAEIISKTDAVIKIPTTTESIDLTTVLTSDFSIIEENTVQIINFTITNTTETPNTEKTAQSIDFTTRNTIKITNDSILSVEPNNRVPSTKFQNFSTVLITDLPVINDDITESILLTIPYKTESPNNTVVDVEQVNMIATTDDLITEPSLLTNFYNKSNIVENNNVLTDIQVNLSASTDVPAEYEKSTDVIEVNITTIKPIIISTTDEVLQTELNYNISTTSVPISIKTSNNKIKRNKTLPTSTSGFKNITSSHKINADELRNKSINFVSNKKQNLKVSPVSDINTRLPIEDLNAIPVTKPFKHSASSTTSPAKNDSEYADIGSDVLTMPLDNMTMTKSSSINNETKTDDIENVPGHLHHPAENISHSQHTATKNKILDVNVEKSNKFVKPVSEVFVTINPSLNFGQPTEIIVTELEERNITTEVFRYESTETASATVKNPTVIDNMKPDIRNTRGFTEVYLEPAIILNIKKNDNLQINDTILSVTTTNLKSSPVVENGDALLVTTESYVYAATPGFNEKGYEKIKFSPLTSSIPFETVVNNEDDMKLSTNSSLIEREALQESIILKPLENDTKAKSENSGSNTTPSVLALINNTNETYGNVSEYTFFFKTFESADNPQTREEMPLSSGSSIKDGKNFAQVSRDAVNLSFDGNETDTWQKLPTQIKQQLNTERPRDLNDPSLRPVETEFSESILNLDTTESVVFNLPEAIESDRNIRQTTGTKKNYLTNPLENVLLNNTAKISNGSHLLIVSESTKSDTASKLIVGIDSQDIFVKISTLTAESESEPPSELRQAVEHSINHQTETTKNVEDVTKQPMLTSDTIKPTEVFGIVATILPPLSKTVFESIVQTDEPRVQFETTVKDSATERTFAYNGNKNNTNVLLQSVNKVNNVTETTLINTVTKISYDGEQVSQVDVTSVDKVIQDANINSSIPYIENLPDLNFEQSSTQNLRQGITTTPTVITTTIREIMTTTIDPAEEEQSTISSTTMEPLSLTTKLVTNTETSLSDPLFDCQTRPSGRYADNNDCRKFYICSGIPKPIIGLCPVNTVFSEIRKQCTKNLAHCIRENEFKCVSSGRYSDYIKQNVYYICVQRGRSFMKFKLQCQNGYNLNKTTIRCYRNPDSESLSQSISTDVSQGTTTTKSKQDRKVEKKSKNKQRNYFECEKEGKFADSDDCRKYYMCRKTNKSDEFRRKVKKCDSDEVFHKKKKRCVDADSYECS